MDTKNNLELDPLDSFAIYRLPNTMETILIIQKGSAKKIEKEDYLNEGFIFHPFNSNKHNSYFIKAQKTYRNTKWSFSVINKISTIDISKTDYIQKINHLIYDINEDMTKVVFSRSKLVERKTENIENIFNKMCYLYPNAFCSVVYTPDTGCWLGATPEQLLIGTSPDNFSTMSLAGTRKIGQLNTNKQWSKKEIEEQDIVTKYIKNLLKKLNIKYKESEVKTLRIGDIEHLCSLFNFNYNNTAELLNEFHPTPAICGMPKDTAYKYILEHEGYDRRYYSGYLGPTSHNKLPKIFVNLRCMELFDNLALLYIGGGITKASIALDEWNETEWKSNIMKALL